MKEDVKYLDKERDIRDYGTGVAEGTDTFTKVTGTSFMDIDNAIKEALRYTYPTDTEECIEYLKEQIEWELERHCREMTDEEVRHAIDTLKINITDETIIFTIDGEDYEYPKSYLKQEEKEPDDLDNIDDLLDQDDLGVADYFIK